MVAEKKEIPSGWTLAEFGTFVKRKPDKHNPKASDKNLPCLELEHFEQGTGKINGWTDSQLQASIKNVFEKEVVLFGKLRPYLKKYWFTEFNGVCSSEVWVLEGEKSKCNNKFLFYLVQQHRFIEACNKTTGSKMPRADWETVKEEPFHLPPLLEQQKIAAILSKWDELIETQTQLITTKEKHKTSLMQKLLTGEVRFPGFEDEWEYEKIGSICKTYSGGTPRRNIKEYYGGHIPWIKSGELNNSNIFKTEEYITELGLKSSSAKLVPENTVLLAMYGATAGVIAITRIEATLNQAILAILPNETLTFSFLYFYLNFVMPYELQRLIQGGQPNLSADVVKSIDLAIPSIVEQEKITSFLSNCDDEIQSLKDELEAIKLQKKGLMQQLLTGKIRVKV